MRLFLHDSDFFSVASALSLAAANYKPIPQLPSQNTASSLSTLTNGTALRANSFKVKPQSDSYFSTHSIAEWGEPSTLYVPVNSTDGRQLATSRRVGPGNCPYSEGYTPKGGWSALPPPTFPPFDATKATIMRYRQQQGVNLGSWFVQEGWMESNFMSCATGSKQAEHDIVNGFGTSAAGLRSARAYMEEHWDTWITEDDFLQMAQMGINTVRLPIGYWSAGPYFTHDSPFAVHASVYQHSWRYIARAINWAAKYDIGVILDLHGAYGSQNGQAHSGLADGNIQFYDQQNLDLTTELLVWLAKEISDVTNLIGIQLLNEPQNNPKYWEWLPKTMDAMRNASDYAKTVPLYFHDAFVLNKGAKFVSTRSDFVVSDHHAYYVYSDSDQSTTANGHTRALSSTITSQFQTASSTARRNLIVGEWSCALARSSLHNSKDRETDQRNFCNAQQDLWSSVTGGFTFWSWKLENCSDNPGWCFKGSLGRFLPKSFNSWGFNATMYNGNATQKVESSVTNMVNKLKVPNSSAIKTSAKQLKSEDLPRIGMVVEQKRGIGSPFSQAVQRRASADAAALGFNDGFLTSRIFAGQAHLSRLGFADQYRQDTFSAHVSAKSLAKSDEATYKKQFATGVQAAEAAISYIVTSKSKA